MLLPGYFLEAFVVSVVVLALSVCFYRWRPQTSRVWLDIVSVLIIAVTLIDLRLSQIMGVRLDWQVIAFGDSPKMMWRMVRPYLPALGFFIAFVVVLYALALRGLRHSETKFVGNYGGVNRNSLFSLATFVLLASVAYWRVTPDKARGQAIVHLAQTSYWWKKAAAQKVMSDEVFLKMADEFDLTPLPPVKRAARARDLNVLLIFQESTYNKYLPLFSGAEPTQPLLEQYKERMEIYPNFFSSFAGSIWARFATFSGLYPVRDFNAFTLKRIEEKSIFEVLHDNGYACSLFYSSYLDYTGFRDLLRNRGLNELYDADTMPGERKTRPVSWGLQEEETLGAIQRQIHKYGVGKQKFFLTYVPAAPHYPYDNIPTRFRKYQLQNYREYKPAYLNDLLYMDWVIASILDELKASELLDKTLVVIMSDHGEMLGGDDGAIGHGWKVTPQLQNIPLIILDPEKPGYRINYTIGSQVDLLATLLDILQLPVPVDQLSQGISLRSVDARTNRLFWLNSMSQFGVIHGYQFTGGDRTSGNQGRTLTFANVGSHTVFSTNEVPQTTNFDIARFDKFQEALLNNYSHFREVLLRARTNN
jgi:phosphoglycerol transferase MdoB-like AlkP superfamily enzyme